MVIEGKKAEASGVRLGILNFTLQSWEGTLSFFFLSDCPDREEEEGWSLKVFSS